MLSKKNRKFAIISQLQKSSNLIWNNNTIFNLFVTDHHAEALSYILKIGHSFDGPTKEMMEVFNVFGKEVEMYKSVVPNMERLLRKSGDFTIFAPK